MCTSGAGVKVSISRLSSQVCLCRFRQTQSEMCINSNTEIGFQRLNIQQQAILNDLIAACPMMKGMNEKEKALKNLQAAHTLLCRQELV